MKPFFGIFSTFFTQGNGFHAHFLSKFSRKETGFTHTFKYFFHAWLEIFHARKFENFHGRVFIFTEGFFVLFSNVTNVTRNIINPNFLRIENRFTGIFFAKSSPLRINFSREKFYKFQKFLQSSKNCTD